MSDGGCECAGLTMRGRHLLIFDTIENTNELRRQLIEELNFPPTYAFTTDDLFEATTKSFSMLSKDLPDNVKLMTLTNNMRI